MKTKKKFGDKIDIEWIDSVEQFGWKTVDEAIETENEEWFCKTSALYVGENDNFIIIAHTVGASEDNAIVGILKIPKVSILKLK